jgi:hypothetical protein
MNDLLQPGKVHLKGPEGEFDAGDRCFLEIWPVRAASVAKEALQSAHEHFVMPLVQCRALRCLRRSDKEAKDAPQVFPQGMIHWQTSTSESADMSCVRGGCSCFMVHECESWMANAAS